MATKFGTPSTPSAGCTNLGNKLVSQAWEEIATAHLLDGLPDPRKPANPQSHTGLDKRLTRQLNNYGLKDTPVGRE